MTILVCSIGQSNLQEKQSSRQGASPSLNFKDCEPPTWKFEKIEFEKQIKDWKKKYEQLQEETKKTPVSASIFGKVDSDNRRAVKDAVS